MSFALRPAPHAPCKPSDAYRAAPLPALRIAPDRRRLFYSLTLCLGVALGVVGVRAVERALTPAFVVASAPRFSLEGRHILLPTMSASRGTSPAPSPFEGPVVVHVWFQEHDESTSAFAAMRVIDQAGGLGLPQINVAYRTADPAWAAWYGVHEHLLLDAEGLLVSQLGTSSFLTLVLDEHHVVRLVDQPDVFGYTDRVHGAFRALTSAHELEPHDGPHDLVAQPTAKDSARFTLRALVPPSSALRP